VTLKFVCLKVTEVMSDFEMCVSKGDRGDELL